MKSAYAGNEMKSVAAGNEGLLLVFGGIFSLAGAIVLAHAQANLSLLEHSSNTPHTITATELSASGPGNNYYVHITNFKLINPRIGSRSEDAKHVEYFLVCDMIPTQASHQGQKHVPKNHKQLPRVQTHNSLIVSNFYINNYGSTDLNHNDSEHFLRRTEMKAFAHPPSDHVISIEVKPRPSVEDNKITWKCGAFSLALGVGFFLMGFRKK